MEENKDIGEGPEHNQAVEQNMPSADDDGMNSPEQTAEPGPEGKREKQQKRALVTSDTADNKGNSTQPMGLGGFLLMLVILAIPVVNIIALIRWSVSKNVNRNKRNLSRAIFLLGILAFALYLAGPRLAQSISATEQEPSAWAEAEIARALELGLLEEEDAAYYAQAITREEMVELAVRVYEKSVSATAKQMNPNPFSDTQNSAVLKAAQLNIISGNAPAITEFRPLGPVDRQTMAVILLNTAKAACPTIMWDTAEKADFKDAGEIDGWALEAVHFAFNQNIIGAHENNVAPHLLISREEAIVCAGRLCELLV